MKNLKLLLAVGMAIVTMNISAQSQNKANASKMIDLANSVIDLSNQYNRKWKDYENVIEQAEKLYERYSKSYDPKFSVNFNGTTSLVSVGYYNTYQDALKATPASMPDKNKIAGAVKIANNNTESLEKWAKAMRKYFVEATFASDNFEGYAPTLDSLNYFYDEAVTSWRLAVRTASEAGDNAEMLLIKGTPMEKFLSPMKSDLRMLRNVIDDFYAEVDKDEFDFSSIKKEAEAVIASVGKNKSTEGKNVSILSHLVYYTDFFEKADKCANTILTLTAELEKEQPEERQLERLFNSLQIQHTDVINSYNNFAEYGSK
jgi:hypothetical protein